MKGLKLFGTLVTIGGFILSFIGKAIDDRQQEMLIDNKVSTKLAEALSKR